MRYPKKDYRQEQERRKRTRKRIDREFQIENETHRCSVGHWAEQTVSHHLIGRRHLRRRYDPSNSTRLCLAHHNELHSIGRSAFEDKYGPVSDGKTCPSV